MAMFKGLMSYSAPKTYEQIFAGVDKSQVVLVTGDEVDREVAVDQALVGEGDAHAPGRRAP